MSRIPKLFLSSVAGLVLFLSVPAFAKADSFTAIFLGTTPAGVNTQFNYSLQYTASGGALTSEDFVTIYDVPGLVGIGLLGPFGDSIHNLGLTPPGVSPTDDPTIFNVTFGYFGATITGSSTFNNFFIISTFGFTQTGTFAGQTHTATGALVGNIGSVTIPSATNPVPEPATMLLLGAGLAGIAAKVRKRRKTV